MSSAEAFIVYDRRCLCVQYVQQMEALNASVLSPAFSAGHAVTYLNQERGT